tara:strand:+ start:4431 stop:5168 length:738 start_codon:yes stop_codon:yes gene_type:complete
MSNLNVLVFHRVVEDEISEWSDVKLSLFKQLLITAKCNNQIIVSINDWSKNYFGDLAFSFDDGCLSDYEVVFPLLIKFNVLATFFIVPKLVNQKGYMTWNQIKEMSDAGMEIASHSMTHPYMTTLPAEQLLRELKDSKIQIERYIGKEVTSFAYPFGDCTGRTHKAAIEVGYKNICTSRPGICKSKIKILNRNSIHSNIVVSESNQLLNPNFNSIMKRQTGYLVRHVLKRFLGVSRYIKLRNFIY